MTPLLRFSSLLCVCVLLAMSFISTSSQAQNFPKHLVAPQRAEQAEDVHAADLDGDGDLDVLSASSGDDKIAWYENTGSGSFSEQKVITTNAASAKAVFATDLDGDNDQDVLSASAGDDKIAWYENTGGGSFSDQKVITTNASAFKGIDVFAADLDGDGDEDVLSASSSDDKIAWYENTDGSSFSSQKVITTSIENPQTVYATDLNNDQNVDIVFGSGGTFSPGKVAWVENNGSSFSNTTEVTSNVSEVRSVFIVDVNGDSDPDILSASQGDDKIAWYKNSGDSFDSQRIISTSVESASSVRTSDLDGDGDEDVIATGKGDGATEDDGAVSIFENQGGGSFGGELPVSGDSDGASSVKLADLDGDGEKDIVVSLLGDQHDESKVVWHRNEFNEGGTFGSQNEITPRQLVDGVQETVPADIDDDGSSDIISASSSNNSIAWYNNTSNGKFGSQIIISNNSTGVSVGVGDINSDEEPDVVYHSEPSGDIVWKENNVSNGESFGMERTVSTVSTNPNSISISDIDLDGRKDIVASFSGTTRNRKIVWYRNMGGGSFSTENIVSDNVNGPTDIRIIDLDNDNYIDVISSARFDEEVRVFFNNGSGNFSDSELVDTNSDGFHSVYSKDITGDGLPDIVAAALFDDEVTWYENEGNRSFSSAKTVAQSIGQPVDVHLADFNNDNKLDIISASDGGINDAKIFWYEQSESFGNISFSAPKIIDSPPGRSVNSADFNSDGAPDILAGLSPRRQDEVAWYKSTSGASIVVNDDEQGTSPPCESTPDANTISAAMSQSGNGVIVCSGSYDPEALDVQKNVTLRSGSGVTITNQLTLSSGSFDVSSGTLTLSSTGESASARIAGSGVGSITGDVTVERFIDYAPTDVSHWRMMASPVASPLDQQQGGGGGEHATYTGPPLLSNTWTQGDGVTGANAQGSGADASVFYYDETASVGTDLTAGWTAVPDLTNLTSGGSIESQEGFAVFLFQDRDFDGSSEGFPITLSATGPVSGAENDGSDVALPVSCTDNDGSGSDGCTDPNDGWNLVANPFVSHVDWNDDGGSGFTKSGLEANAYIYDADDGAYEQTDGTNNGDPFIAPFQAFFVKSDATSGSEGSVDLKVNSNAKADPANSDDREFKSVDAEPLVSLQLSDGNRVEETRVTFREDAEAGKDRYDGYQLTPLSGDYHVLASEIDGRGGTYDSQYRPLPPEDSLTIDLAVTTTSAGTYTIDPDTLANLPTDLQVKVLDTQTGETANLRAGESLSFTVESGATVSSKQKSPRDLLANGPVQKATASGVISSRFDLQIIPGSAIPVELASFNATANKGEADLRWETASETNNAGFVIERRAEGNVWSEIGFVEGAGTTDQSRTYRFTDANIPFEAERVTYRLRQKDLDGTTSLSDETTVELGPPSMAKLHAPFPNPASQQATVRYEVPDGLQGSTLEISVYDVLGRQVHIIESSQAKPGRHERRVSVGDLPTGTYFVRMRAENTTETRRLTIVR